MWSRITDAILTSKWNKPFPVTLLPSAITFYLTEKQQVRHRQILQEIRALGDHDIKAANTIASHPA
ncbi:hypothetical protein PYCC9005_004268 [Savitreella phatthalungensis]